MSKNKAQTISLLRELHESVRLGDRPGMEHLKSRVQAADGEISPDKDAAQRHYMHLQASDKLSPDEREELNALHRGREKLPTNPKKKLQFDVDNLKTQLQHHQAQLARAYNRLNEPSLDPKLVALITHITIPEQKGFVKKLEAQISKKRNELKSM